MPITKIIIENFKGIRDRVEIPIRPLTLLFGANSAGKTTVLHALLYLRELLERQNADADRVIVVRTSTSVVSANSFMDTWNRKRSRLA